MQMKKFQFFGENGFLMCIRNVLDGFMAWYWRNLANGPVTPAREMVRHRHSPVTKLGDPGSNWSQLTGQSPPHSGVCGENDFFWLHEHYYDRYCHRASHKYLLPRLWRKVCSPADTNKFKVPGLIPASQVTSQVCDRAAKYKHGARGRLLTPSPPGPCSDRGWGLPVFVTKINKWSAQTRQTDRTVEEWIKHSSSGWQPGGYLIFVVIYSHSSLSGWLYLPDPESPVRSQAGNTFLRLLLTEICLTSILDTFKNRINQLNYGNAEALFSASLQQFTGKT